MTVTVAAPVVAVVEAASVSTVLVPVVVVVPGLNVAVTPPGKPLALNATVLENPPEREIVTVLVPLAPRLTVKLVGLRESEKSGPLTVRLMVVVCVSVAPVPVNVTAAAPSVAVVEAASVTTELVPVVVVVAGLKLAVTPAGKPLALNATVLANLR